jgi:hypothetical protein
MSKQSIAWWVAAAVAAIFLLGVGPVGNYGTLGGLNALTVMTGIILLFVGAIASIVALYWSSAK